MKKNYPLFASLLLLMLSACGGEKSKTESTDVAETESTEVSAQEEIVGLINELYAAAAKNEGGIDQRYACRAWQKTVAAVKEKDSHVAEIGFFNEDYWTMMQDSNPADLEVRDIQFEKLDDEKGTAMVSFILHSSTQIVRRKFELCREDGDWRVHNIISYFCGPDGKEDVSNLLEAMQSYLDEPLEDEVQELTFADVTGIYDDEYQQARICLYEEGRATWGMIGSLNYIEYFLTINGHTICLESIDDDSEKSCYEYDENTHTLTDEQGEVYYRQAAD